MTDLSIVIVSYQSRDHLKACLSSLPEGVAGIAAEVVVVDNASSDGTVDWLAEEWPEVRVIEMGENAGFARATNAGAAGATGRHLLLLNPDTEVTPGALEFLVRFLDDRPEVGVLAPRLVYPDGTDQGTARAFPTPSAALFGRRSPLTRLFPANPWSRRFLIGRHRPTDRPFPVDWVSGACLMVRSELFRELGGFDEGFFMHFEDADLCHRAKAAGWEVWCEPRAVVVHLEGGSRQGWPPEQIRYFHRGAYRYYARNHLGGPKAVLRPLARVALAVRGEALIVRDRLARAEPHASGNSFTPG